MKKVKPDVTLWSTKVGSITLTYTKQTIILDWPTRRVVWRRKDGMLISEERK